ncbi:MAG: acyl-CoA dehydrogenase family protein [Candidatus Nanopelagicales bacterium]
MGNWSSDIELVFDEVRVPMSNTIGEVGRGFQQQMAQFQNERLIGAYMAVASMRKALDKTKDYLQRDAFGKPLQPASTCSKLAGLRRRRRARGLLPHVCADLPGRR